MLDSEGGQFFMKGFITGHIKLMAIFFGCAYVLVAALVIIFGAYEGLIFLGVFTVAIAIFVGIFYGAYRMIFKQVIDNIPDIPQLSNPELLKKGQPAQAKILAVEDTGVTINEINPMIKLLLEVHPNEGEPYRAETRLLINRTQIPQFQPGMTIPVMVDPEDREQVAVGRPEDGDAMVMETGADSEEAHQAEQMLIRIDEENKKILATGQQARAKVLQAHDMGIRVNGPNTAMQFVLEVQPPGGEPFQAQATGVIFEGSVPKFQPGNTIYVKYDPKDITRVSVYRSY